jgi:hypothetical protein
MPPTPEAIRKIRATSGEAGVRFRYVRDVSISFLANTPRHMQATARTQANISQGEVGKIIPESYHVGSLAAFVPSRKLLHAHNR